MPCWLFFLSCCSPTPSNIDIWIGIPLVDSCHAPFPLTSTQSEEGCGLHVVQNGHAVPFNMSDERAIFIANGRNHIFIKHNTQESSEVVGDYRIERAISLKFSTQSSDVTTLCQQSTVVRVGYQDGLRDLQVSDLPDPSQETFHCIVSRLMSVFIQPLLKYRRNVARTFPGQWNHYSHLSTLHRISRRCFVSPCATVSATDAENVPIDRQSTLRLLSQPPLSLRWVPRSLRTAPCAPARCSLSTTPPSIQGRLATYLSSSLMPCARRARLPTHS